MRVLRIDNRSAEANHERGRYAFATIFLSIMICSGRETPYRLRMSVSFMPSCVSSHLAVSVREIEQGEIAHVLKAILDRAMGP